MSKTSKGGGRLQSLAASDEEDAKARSHDPAVWNLLFVAWVTALGSTLAALFIGEVMGQTPCVLCWYQRAFMFPLAVVLAVACYVSDRRVWRYALPLAVVGWLIAVWHSLLFTGVVAAELVPCGAGPSCSSANMTILGGVPLPILSVIAFSTIIASLMLIQKKASP